MDFFELGNYSKYDFKQSRRRGPKIPKHLGKQFQQQQLATSWWTQISGKSIFGNQDCYMVLDPEYGTIFSIYFSILFKRPYLSKDITFVHHIGRHFFGSRVTKTRRLDNSPRAKVWNSFYFHISVATRYDSTSS